MISLLSLPHSAAIRIQSIYRKFHARKEYVHLKSARSKAINIIKKSGGRGLGQKVVEKSINVTAKKKKDPVLSRLLKFTKSQRKKSFENVNESKVELTTVEGMLRKRDDKKKLIQVNKHL